jgi:hypothetical protein
VADQDGPVRQPFDHEKQQRKLGDGNGQVSHDEPLVEAAEQPDHQDDRQRNPDQPQQQSASHCSLLSKTAETTPKRWLGSDWRQCDRAARTLDAPTLTTM